MAEEIWATESLNKLPKATQLVSGRNGIQILSGSRANAYNLSLLQAHHFWVLAMGKGDMK